MRQSAIQSLACLMLLAAAASSTQAATYYVSNGSLSDNNSGTNTVFPWKTIAKVNATAKAGDTVLFARGGVWEETLQVKSGVTYADYKSSGAKPVIRGSTDVGKLSWSVYSGNIRVADASKLNVGTIAQLYLNGVRLNRARHPNIGKGDWGSTSHYFKIAADTPSGANYLTPAAGVIPSGADLGGAVAYVRNVDYALLDYDVTGVIGGQLQLKLRLLDPRFTQTDYPYDIKAGWGYWLENKLWMLDSPGEWYYDAAARKLYAWMPNGASPSGQALMAAVRANAIVATGATDFTIRNMEVSETAADGIVMQGAARATVSGVSVNRPGAKGIAITASTSSTLDSLLVQDSVRHGIWMGDFRYAETSPSSSINLTNSTIRNAGRGYYAHSAVMLGDGGTVSNNIIENSSYIGLHAWKNSVISGNLIKNSCLDFDDCGAIYAIGRGETGRPEGYPLNLTIRNNFVDGAPASPDGNAGGGGATKGIYMDDFARASKVQNNFVMGTAVGYMLHFARDIEVSGNFSFNNRVSEVWLQENTVNNPFDCTTYGLTPCDASNYLVGNNFFNNTFVSTGAASILWQSSDFASTGDFASYSANTYAAMSNRFMVRDEFGASVRPSMTLAQWKALGKDVQSTMFSTVPSVTALANATSLVQDGTFDLSGQGWTSYNGDALAVGSGCLDTKCMSVTPRSAAEKLADGRSKFIYYTTQGFAVQAGKQYLVAFDVRAALPGESLYAVVRDPAAGYKEVTTQGPVDLKTTWQRVHRLLTANSTVNGTARLDIEIHANGTVYIDNVRLLEAKTTSGTEGAIAFYNANPASVTFNCPASDQNRCSQYVDLRTGTAVTFPLTMAAKTAKIAVWKSSPWQDSDGDGVPNSVDACPNTLVDEGTDERGCAIGQ
ncbi:MAG: right-handed parallel beta-helix repeat-containing protein [Pseudomonadota bacterium]